MASEAATAERTRGSLWDEEPSIPNEMTLVSPMEIKSQGTPDDDVGSAYSSLIAFAQAIQRDPGTMIRTAQQVGGLMGSDGFYRFPMGGGTVEGISIGLAQALAQAWRGIVYQVRIIEATPLQSGGQRVHLRARVVDLQAIVLAEVDQVLSTSAPPAGFAKNGEQRERWHTMQMQSAASKVVRNAILRVLPDWYTEPAFQAAIRAAATKATGGKPLAEARLDAVAAMAGFGIQQAELESWLNLPIEMWAAPQLEQIRNLYSGFKSGNMAPEAWRKGDSQAAAPAAPQGRAALGIPTAAAAGQAATPTPQAAAVLPEAFQVHPDLTEKHGEKAQECIRMERELSPAQVLEARKGAGVAGVVTSAAVLERYRKGLLAAFPA